ncbi:MAG: S41 family peptidase [Ginsengibacter sp.]
MIAVIGSFTACKKNPATETTIPPVDTTAVVSASDKEKDSVVAYSREAYLWYTQIPSSFNGRSYADPAAIMEALRQYSQEPGFSAPVDRFSFASTKEDWDNVSSGIGGDFGLGVFYMNTSDLRVKFVEPASPAGQAGVQRGWRVTKLNGSANVNYSNLDFVIDKIFNSTSTTFTFEKPNGTSIEVPLNVGSYNSKPVHLDSVYGVSGKKVGYLVFNSFIGDTNQINTDLAAAFARFTSANVNDIIVDLRYNGGGYVSIQERMANYLAPASANGGIMMKQVFNDNLAQYNETTRFHKIGSINLTRIFFIVSHATASASELLINNLKPYMDVKILGPKPTYGKPVGFFPIPVGDWYIFPVSFRTTNKNNEGGYFDGLPLDKEVADGLDKNWGDLNEDALASAVKYITTGTFTVVRNTNRPAINLNQPEVIRSNDKLNERTFKGTVDVRFLR